MKDYQRRFLQVCIDNQILMLGEFTLKSGRISPYFFNAGLFNDGRLLGHVAEGYAALIAEKIPADAVLYGPAYKGIPLVAATAVKLAEKHARILRFSFNRKEIKDHGEGGQIVGAVLNGDVVIVDDVITAGTSINESVAIIQSAGARPSAVIIALDREEVAEGETLSAVEKIEDAHGLPVYSLIRLGDLIHFLEDQPDYAANLKKITEYRQRYGG